MGDLSLPSSRSHVVSSFTIIKGSLIEETYAAFREWDFSRSRFENLERLRKGNVVHASSAHWARDIASVLNRRFDPDGRDRALVDLAKAGCDREIWKPILLWHITRDEFLLRDFLVAWLFPAYTKGACKIRTGDVIPYVKSLAKRKDIEWSGGWADTTLRRVASGLLRLAADFGLLKGAAAKEFASYHLPDESFLYLLHAQAEVEPNGRRIIESEEWRMYLLDADRVEREILRLHQFRKLHYEVAGTLSQIKLPYASSAEYARGLCA